MLPASRAGPTLIASRIIGTFHAVIAATTPSGLPNQDHLLRASLFEHLERQMKRGEVARSTAMKRAISHCGLRQRPALLLGQEAGEFVLPGFERIGQFDRGAARCRSGVADQVGNAAFAAATASSSCARSARGRSSGSARSRD